MITYSHNSVNHFLFKKIFRFGIPKVAYSLSYFRKRLFKLTYVLKIKIAPVTTENYFFGTIELNATNKTSLKALLD